MTKIRSAKQLNEVVTQNSRDIALIQKEIRDILSDIPDYDGGVQINMELIDKPSLDIYYMVTAIEYNDPFMEFFHLVSIDPDKPVNYNSFPQRKPRQKLVNYVKGLYKMRQWEVIKAQVLVHSIKHIETLGFFSYTDKLRTIEFPPIDKPIPDNVILFTGEPSKGEDA